MTNEQILKRVITKAENNGWDFDKAFNKVEKRLKETFYVLPYEVHIFSHQFAKAFWGEEAVCNMCGETNERNCDCKEWVGSGVIEAWKFHLQQMVLLTDDEKFKYLKKFL